MIFASSGCVHIIKNYKNKNPYFLTVKILQMIYYEMSHFLITDPWAYLNDIVSLFGIFKLNIL